MHHGIYSHCFIIRYTVCVDTGTVAVEEVVAGLVIYNKRPRTSVDMEISNGGRKALVGQPIMCHDIQAYRHFGGGGGAGSELANVNL